MVTLHVKWLNGDLRLVEILEQTPVYKVILQLGLTLLETILLSEEGKVLEHLYQFTKDEIVYILVQTPPTVMVIYERYNKSYYITTSDATAKEFSGHIEKLVDKLCIDYMSFTVREELYDRGYAVKIKPEVIRWVCERLKLPEDTEKLSALHLQLCFKESQTEVETVPMSWSSFVNTVDFIPHPAFYPTLSEEMKSKGMLTHKEWASYLVRGR